MRRHIALTTALAALYTTCYAGTDSADTTAFILKSLDVSAVASRQATSSVPIRAVDTDAIMRTGITDVSDALHRMPGVTLRDYGGAGGLKTVSVRGFGAGHTGVFYDGVPLSDVQNGQIDLARYSVDNVDRIQLVVGDNDDIFIPARMAASAATVSISSIPTIDADEFTAKLHLGSFGLVSPFLKAGMVLSDNMAVNISGEYTHADNDYPFKLKNGTVTTTERRNNSNIDSGHAEANLLWRPTSRNTLTAKIYGYTCSRDLPGPVIIYNNLSNEHLKEQNSLFQVQWRSRLAERLSLNAIGKFNYSGTKYTDKSGKYPGGMLDNRYWQREYYTSWGLMYTATGHCFLNYTADYFYNNLNSNTPTNRDPYRHSLLQTATAKYSTRRFTMTARLLMSIYQNGAKIGEAARDYNRLSPSLSLSWQPVQSQLLFVRVSYKNIFRMPTFNEAYFDHYGSTDIKPENTHQINLGATYTAKSSRYLSQAVFTVDVYSNRITDKIVAVPYNMFVWSMTNLGEVHSYGVDATSSVTVSAARGHDISLSCNYGFQRSMPVTDPAASDYRKQVAYIPRSAGSASASYENPWVNISVTGTGVSARYTTNNNLPSTKIPGYTEFSATLWRTFHLGKHTLGVRAGVQNIFNKQYSIIARYPMPGRQFKITLTYKIKNPK